MNLQEFKQHYIQTLKNDPITGERYIKFGITNLDELGHLQLALLEGLLLLAQSENAKEPNNSMIWLCKILIATYPQDELEGLSQWLKDQ